jgi:hypothetical protein
MALRPETRTKLEGLVTFVVSFCYDAAKRVVAPGLGEAARLGVAWSLAQQAALVFQEKLDATAEGRALLARSKAEAELAVAAQKKVGRA